MGLTARGIGRWLVCGALASGCAANTGDESSDELGLPPIRTSEDLTSRVVDVGDLAPAGFRFRYPGYTLNGSWVSTGPSDGYFNIRGEAELPVEGAFTRSGVLEVREVWTRIARGGPWLVVTTTGTRTEVTEEHSPGGLVGREVVTHRLIRAAEELAQRTYWYDHTSVERVGGRGTELGRLEDWRVHYEAGEPHRKTGEVTTFVRQINAGATGSVHEESYERTFWDGPPGADDWTRHEQSEVYAVREGGRATLHTTGIEAKTRTWRQSDGEWKVAGTELSETTHVLVRQLEAQRFYDDVRNETSFTGEREGTTRFHQRREYADLGLSVLRDEVRLEALGGFANPGEFYRRTEFDPSTKAWTFRGRVADAHDTLDLAVRFNALAEVEATALGGGELVPWQGRDLVGMLDGYALLEERERYFTVAVRPIWARHEAAYPYLDRLPPRAP